MVISHKVQIFLFFWCFLFLLVFLFSCFFRFSGFGTLVEDALVDTKRLFLATALQDAPASPAQAMALPETTGGIGACMSVYIYIYISIYIYIYVEPFQKEGLLSYPPNIGLILVL